jgi:hypothetical protein
VCRTYRGDCDKCIQIRACKGGYNFNVHGASTSFLNVTASESFQLLTHACVTSAALAAVLGKLAGSPWFLKGKNTATAFF